MHSHLAVGSKFEECAQAQHEINNSCEEKKMMSSSLSCQVAVQVSSYSAKCTNWSVFDRPLFCALCYRYGQTAWCHQRRAVASGPAGPAMAGPVLINYVDTHAQMQQLSVESRLNILHSS